MTDEQFANACAAIETWALHHQLALQAEPLNTSREDVDAIVRMAKSLRYNHRGEADRIEHV